MTILLSIHLSNACYMLYPSHPHLFDHPNITEVNTIIIIIIIIIIAIIIMQLLYRLN